MKPAIATHYMLDGDKCRYLSFEDGLAICEFREGRTEPERAYDYWIKACKPYPRVSDLREPLNKCTYYLEAEE